MERSGVLESLEAIASDVAPELERTLDQLTATLNVLASQIANDPELRESAARAAHGLVGVAEAVVVERSDVLLEALRAAAERIESLAASRDPGTDPR